MSEVVQITTNNGMSIDDLPGFTQETGEDGSVESQGFEDQEYDLDFTGPGKVTFTAVGEAKGNDQIKAGAGDADIFTGEGDDIIEGGIGDDILRGGEGDDFIKGGLGADILQGGAGDDIIRSGYGADGEGDPFLTQLGGQDPRGDLLKGGSGDDVFVFNANEFEDGVALPNGNVLNNAGVVDTILDFEDGTDDFQDLIRIIGVSEDDLVDYNPSTGYVEIGGTDAIFIGENKDISASKNEDTDTWELL